MRYLIGFIFGVLVTFGLTRFVGTGKTGTLVLTTQRDLQLERGISIPAGVDLVYDRAMDEGFYVARLYLNIDAETYQSALLEKHDDRENLRIPYWVEKKGDNKISGPQAQAAGE